MGKEKEYFLGRIISDICRYFSFRMVECNFLVMICLGFFFRYI